MDTDSPGVLAAAAGVVVAAEDGNYDRCHGSLETADVDCDGHEMRANRVIVEHEIGWRSRYWHLKNGSVAVAEGDVVERGTVLGHVGSSGRSSMPHLHFEVHDPDGVVVDPYAGELSQETSYWCEQDAGDGLPGECQDD